MMTSQARQAGFMMKELATRHRVDADALLEAWGERAAIREYLAGFGRCAAELFAVGDVEQMHQIGLHRRACQRRWLAGGQRMQPGNGSVAV